jgi:glucokinase
MLARRGEPLFERRLAVALADGEVRAADDVADGGVAVACRVAAAVLDHCRQVWGTLAVTLVHAYDPELLVFGGAVMSRGDDILPRVRLLVEGRAWTPGRTVQIARAALADDAPLYGAIPLLGLSK